jgi:hypothetical protein
METPQPYEPEPSPQIGHIDADMATWVALRDELTQLNTQLEYLRLLLKLGVYRL